MEKKMRSIEFGEQKVSVFEGDAFVDSANGKVLTGAWVWDASIVLAYWFTTDSWPKGCFEDKTAVELGAGTALPGLTLAALGAKVLITDREPLLSGITANIAANNLQDRARAVELQWGNDTPISDVFSTPPDFIVGSDVMFEHELTAELAQTVCRIAGKSTRMFFSCELRPPTPRCFDEMFKYGLRWRAIPQDRLHPDWNSNDIKIFEFFLADEEGDGRDIPEEDQEGDGRDIPEEDQEGDKREPPLKD